MDSRRSMSNCRALEGFWRAYEGREVRSGSLEFCFPGQSCLGGISGPSPARACLPALPCSISASRSPASLPTAQGDHIVGFRRQSPNGALLLAGIRRAPCSRIMDVKEEKGEGGGHRWNALGRCREIEMSSARLPSGCSLDGQALMPVSVRVSSSARRLGVLSRSRPAGRPRAADVNATGRRW